MNLLVRLLEKQPQAIDELAHGMSVPFHHVTGHLSFDRDVEAVARAAEQDPDLDRQLGELYLEVVPQAEWDRNEREAEEREPVSADEWVTFLPGRNGVGLSLPDDSAAVQRFSLFHQVDGVVRRASLDEIERGPAGMSMSFSSGHCGLASRGRCTPGGCGGCIPRTRIGRDRSVVCWCEHSQ